MTRGNRREIDRQRASNRHAKDGGAKREGDPKTRNENDAKALAEKVAKKKAMEAGGEAAAGGGGGGDRKPSAGKK
eukprot:CAMPEP_0182427354 /NCGR_PEP_ID=MMETSP1167-20130531/17069_1 /TAXON_ID=2988 /ORGANISM="Mallomonas Sp, Strain CCMP3275" /LENGTH=74 /DNA_ID=CAMNT_0024609535 /DNA_START=100 /DNA_END=324 /DNA_ORIENTATION=+